MIENLSITAALRFGDCLGNRCNLRQAAELLNPSMTMEEAGIICEAKGLIRSTGTEEPILDYAIKNLPVARYECNTRRASDKDKACGVIVVFDRSSFPGR